VRKAYIRLHEKAIELHTTDKENDLSLALAIGTVLERLDSSTLDVDKQSAEAKELMETLDQNQEEISTTSKRLA